MLFFAGSYAANALSLRVNRLEKVCIMFSVIHTQLECCCCPVEPLLDILASSEELSDLKFLSECKNLLATEPFPLAWSTALHDRTNTSGLNMSDVERLISFGNTLGTTALDGQMTNCDMYSADFSLRLSAAREKCTKYSKLLPPLGALLGAVLVIAAI